MNLLKTKPSPSEAIAVCTSPTVHLHETSLTLKLYLKVSLIRHYSMVSLTPVLVLYLNVEYHRCFLYPVDQKSQLFLSLVVFSHFMFWKPMETTNFMKFVSRCHVFCENKCCSFQILLCKRITRAST